MTPTILSFHPNPRKPSLKLPEGACDSHCHIFGAHKDYPYAEGRPYTPHDAPYEKLVELHDHLGISRAVIVNATCHGRDNRVVTDAIKRSKGRFKGVANVDLSFTRQDLMLLTEQGITGCRFTFLPRLGALPNFDDFITIVNRIADFDWHVDLYLPASLLPEFAPRLKALPIKYVLDHLGVVKASEGISQKPFEDLQRLYEQDQKCHIKVSCPERLTALQTPFADVTPFAKTLIKQDATRLFWGTDFPHPNVPFMPDDGDLVDWLNDIANEEEIKQITVSNPHKFFGFST